MISYTSLSALKLYAVARPMAYRQHVTMRRCMIWIGITWLVVIAVVCFKLLLVYLFKSAVIDVQLHWYACQILGLVFFSLYVFTLVAFGATAVYIYRRRSATGLTATG